MNTAITFEERLRLMVGYANEGVPGRAVCTVYQQDVADALSLIGALKTANAELQQAVVKLTEKAAMKGAA